MKKITLRYLFISMCLLILSSCNNSTKFEAKKEIEESISQDTYYEEFIDEMENPPEATNKNEVEITVDNDSSVSDLLKASLWRDAKNVGMDVSFSETSFDYHIEGYDTAGETWRLINECDGELSPDGPYIQRGEGEYADCYLIVKLKSNELLLEHQGSSIQMAFKK